MPEVSVIIPFHNRIEWTKESIQSVLRQTYQDFEIIVVDDGSDINYRNEIEKMDVRIIYLRQSNQGPSCARNTGMTYAQGELIAFLDSDDTFSENKLEFQVGVMRTNPSVLLSHTSFSLMDINGKKYDQINSGKFTDWVYPAILANCPIATPTVMIRKEVLQFARFEEHIHIAEDILFWSNIARKSMLIGIPEFLSQVRNHGGNALFDYDKQLNGLANLVQYGINADQDIQDGQRKTLFAEIYWQFGFAYRKKRQYVKAFYYSFAALIYDLLSPNHMFFRQRALHLIGKLLPVSWRKAIKNFLSHLRLAKGE